MKPYVIAIPIIDEFDLMDVANPYEIFCWLGIMWRDAPIKPQVLLVGHEKDLKVTSFNGATLTTHASFDDLADTNVNVLFVPGGGSDYIKAALADEDLLQFVKDKSEHTQWTASVCTGAFVLAEAGVLDGRRATTHWLFLEKLASEYPAVRIVNGFPRYVTDGKVVIGGGISSGIDAALHLIGNISHQELGREVELAIQYHPNPPWNVGDPAVADYRTWSEVVAKLQPD